MKASIKEKIKRIKEDIVILYIAMRRKDTPLMAKIIVWLTVAYALSPIDLIPDFIPVVGYLDDFLILPFLIFISFKMIPKNIVEQCRSEAKRAINGKEEKKYIYAIPVIFIWIIVIIIILKIVLNKFL